MVSLRLRTLWHYIVNEKALVCHNVVSRDQLSQDPRVLDYFPIGRGSRERGRHITNSPRHRYTHQEFTSVITCEKICVLNSEYGSVAV